jgi:hypothetical protein
MKDRLVASLIFVCAVCALSGVGSAQRRDSVTLFGPTGSQLLENCSEPPVEVGDVVPVDLLLRRARNNGMCAGYIAGVNDNQASQVASGQAPTFCLPAGVQIDQLAKVVRKYLEDNPAKLHLPGGILVKSALDQAFPCR